ncbi:hypothetical protein B0H16DRAFT_1686984 [Mycena metata]|uniref:Uncharacterized protein n=1 Tax=Mycena metata TaxID=1033252 RepID=A0AAD7NLY7_9AGAR|nr:hypothetical protein B0H16DRAFT_1686984 [Mycena metata]
MFNIGRKDSVSRNVVNCRAKRFELEGKLISEMLSSEPQLLDGTCTFTRMAQLNIHSILKTLQIPTKVHSLYLVGSRLWGTHSAKSDFNLLVVITDPSSSAPPSFQKSQHKGQYDATVLTEAEFRAQVEAGSLIESLCCLLEPSEECVLMHEESHQRRGLVGNLQTMRDWADERAQKDREKAKKFWAKGGAMREKGWKILQHTIGAETSLRRKGST